uniref:Lrp/AsnC family transcriptional regulator n=1 Tax=candidate division WOR-3 bacterium TaxID=2052148 RepID=A0A7C3UV60_UNCW3
MKARAFVLINCQAGTTRRIVEKLQQIPGVEYAEAVTGPYDIIAIVSGSDVNYIGVVIAERIQTIEGVEKTITCNVVRFDSLDSLIY